MDSTLPTDSNLIHYSNGFNDEAAEIVFQSSDNIQLRVHAICLKTHSGILAPQEGASLNEVVLLTEPASVLRLLFEFIYPTLQPVLATETNFDVLRDLADAAEKYQVFPAMYACQMAMQSMLPIDNYAIFVLGYALKHGYADLVNEAAPLAVDAAFPDTLCALPPEFLDSWWKYRDIWENVRKQALSAHAQNMNIVTVSTSASELSSFRNCEQNFRYQGGVWLSKVKRDVADIPRMCDVIGDFGGHQDRVEESTSINGITIQSCDGVDHYVEPDVLRTYSKGLYDSKADQIKVPETSSTIGLLLKFLRPARFPDLAVLPFEELRALAVTAEKYAIHPAMGICRTMMKKRLPNNAKEIFQYALDTHYFDVLDLTAQLHLGRCHSFTESIQDIPPMLLIPWARYYQNWQDARNRSLHEVTQAAMELASQWYHGHSGNVEYCSGCRQLFPKAHLSPILSALMEGPESLTNLDSLFPLEETRNRCSAAYNFFNRCKPIVERMIEVIPSLSSLV